VKVASPSLGPFGEPPREVTFISAFFECLALGLLPVGLALAGVWYGFGLDFLTAVVGGSVLVPALIAVALGVLSGCAATSLSRRVG
jgi:hypothetical protein